jgi:hypothetical protein
MTNLLVFYEPASNESIAIFSPIIARRSPPRRIRSSNPIFVKPRSPPGCRVRVYVTSGDEKDGFVFESSTLLSSSYSRNDETAFLNLS